MEHRALPLGYLGTALAEGAAAYVVLLAATKVDRAAVSFFGALLLAAGCISLATTALYGVVSGAFASEVGALYVIGALLAGGAAPAVAGFMVWKKPEKPNDMGRDLLWYVLFAGALVYRCAMWLLGETLYGFFNLL